MKEIYYLILELVLKGQGSVRNFSRNRSTGRYHVSYPPSTYLARCLQGIFLTLSFYLASITCPTPAFSCKPTLPNTPTKAGAPPKWLLSITPSEWPRPRLAPPPSGSLPECWRGALSTSTPAIVTVRSYSQPQQGLSPPPTMPREAWLSYKRKTHASYTESTTGVWFW